LEHIVLEAVNDLRTKNKYSTESAIVKLVTAKYPDVPNHLVLEQIYKCIRGGLIEKVRKASFYSI
jgi:hypothetical protein